MRISGGLSGPVKVAQKIQKKWSVHGGFFGSFQVYTARCRGVRISGGWSAPVKVAQKIKTEKKWSLRGGFFGPFQVYTVRCGGVRIKNFGCNQPPFFEFVAGTIWDIGKKR